MTQNGQSEKVESRKTPENDNVANALTDQVSNLTLSDEDTIIICDAGYGLPSEARPRKEKVLAIARQLYNFLEWQMKSNKKRLARIKVVGAGDVVASLQDRLQQLWEGPLPSHVEFTSQDFKELVASNTKEVIYLSPDASKALDPSIRPPHTVVVGLLIDRRIQPNRSKNRASKLEIQTARWPLEEFSNIDTQEPLNVDTVMEGMQEWWWYCDEKNIGKECFLKAATGAIERHAQRHPNRPLHKIRLPGMR